MSIYIEENIKVFLQLAKKKEAIPTTLELAKETKLSVGTWNKQLNDFVFLVLLSREVEKTINRTASKIDLTTKAKKLWLFKDIRDFCYANIISSLGIDLDKFVIKELKNELSLLKEDLSESQNIENLSNLISRTIRVCDSLLKIKFVDKSRENVNPVGKVLKDRKYFQY